MPDAAVPIGNATDPTYERRKANPPPQGVALLKRSFDLILGLCGIILLFPILAVIAIAIRLTSPGPIFYRGVRTGRGGQPFRIYKFRSMVVDAESMGGTTTGARDHRITAAGAILRRYKLDELPQLLNVLDGTMSFVGPRPEVPEYTDQYTLEEREILSVRPGITDLASMHFSDLQGVVGGEDPDATYRRLVLPEKNRLRLQYVRTRSFWLDLRILLETVRIVLCRLTGVRKSRGITQ